MIWRFESPELYVKNYVQEKKVEDSILWDNGKF